MTEIIDRVTTALAGRYEIDLELGAATANLRDLPLVLVEMFLVELKTTRGGS